MVISYTIVGYEYYKILLLVYLILSLFVKQIDWSKVNLIRWL